MSKSNKQNKQHTEPSQSLCQKCKTNLGSRRDHFCPYSEEIDNKKVLCNCCVDCTHECCMDI